MKGMSKKNKEIKNEEIFQLHKNEKFGHEVNCQHNIQFRIRGDVLFGLYLKKKRCFEQL